MNITIKPTIEQSTAFQNSFDYLNSTLFGGILQTPMLSLTRNANILGGYFVAEKWIKNRAKVSEIALNANLMQSKDIVHLMGVLVHEMIHLWQHYHGKKTRNGYHNQEFASKAHDLGLKNINVKEPTKCTGQNCTQAIIREGATWNAVVKLPEDCFFPYLTENLGSPDPQEPGAPPTPQPTKQGQRTKYTCPICGANVWGKAGLVLSCVLCNQNLIEQLKQ